MAVRREIIRMLNQARQQGRFWKANALKVFIEVRARRFGKSTNRERATLPHVNLIGVEFEYLLFAETLLQLDRDEHLFQLALDGLLRT